MLRKAILWTGISQTGQYGIQFISTIILARLLTPEDFGIVGMVTIFITFSQVVVDSEMGGALLRKKIVFDIDFSTLFVYNLIISIILYLILYFFAPILASFYEKPILVPVIRILSISVLLHSFRIVQRIKLLRQLNFKVLALISVISGLISLLIAIWMGVEGYGFWALIIQQLVSISISVLIMCFYNKYWPSFSFSFSSFKEQFLFGIGLLGADTLKTIANNINANVIAKVMPLNQTGYFVQSTKLTNFSVNIVSAVMDQTLFPIMSKIDDNVELYDLYSKFYRLTTAVLTYITMWIILLSSSLIVTLLGEHWVNASWMLSALSLTILPCSIQTLCRNILKSRAETRKVFLIETVKSVLMILALLITSIWGIYAIIVGTIVVQLLVAVWMMYIISFEINYSLFDQIKNIIPSILICIVVFYCISWLQSFLLISEYPIIDICIVTCTSSLLFLIASWYCGGKEIILILRRMIYSKTKK